MDIELIKAYLKVNPNTYEIEDHGDFWFFKQAQNAISYAENKPPFWRDVFNAKVDMYLHTMGIPSMKICYDTHIDNNIQSVDFLGNVLEKTSSSFAFIESKFGLIFPELFEMKNHLFLSCCYVLVSDFLDPNHLNKHINQFKSKGVVAFVPESEIIDTMKQKFYSKMSEEIINKLKGKIEIVGLIINTSDILEFGISKEELI